MKKVEYNTVTGAIVETDMTTDEIATAQSLIPAASQERLDNLAARQTEYEAKQALKASARAKLVAGQPLTEEEASVITI